MKRVIWFLTFISVTILIGYNTIVYCNGLGDNEKVKIARGSWDAGYELSKRLYYLDNYEIFFVDTETGYTRKINDFPELWKIDCTSTYIFPNENQTGNRFMVLYNHRIKDDFSFVMFDKLTGKIDHYR